ncbi:hypothetical protein ACZ90_69150 [Streptomyces albus subsp. albus]|nr:hypothetical protein ACZ90_69150 [Streptomyces albus subsp. albus]
MTLARPTAAAPAAVDTPTPAPPGRWAVRAAHLTALCVLPASLWRIALALGVPLGYSAQTLRQDFDAPGWGTAYMLGLSLLSELLAFLTIGLVRPWGEVMPHWIPVLGGRRVAPRAAAAVAATGATLLCLAFTVLPVVQMIALGHGPEDLHGAHLWLMQACYLPLLAWGPLLAWVTYDYHRRHRV